MKKLLRNKLRLLPGQKLLSFFMTLLTFAVPAVSQTQTFVHPGIPFTQADLNQLKSNITQEPWLSGYNELKNDSRSRLDYVMKGPFATVTRAPNLYNAEWKSDMMAIHNLAFMWVFTGDAAYARKATDMLDAWALTNTVWGGNESMLDIGDYAPYFITGADILRGTYPGWTTQNTAHVKDYFANVLWPHSWVPNPLRDHNKGAIQLEIAIGIAAFLDDPVKWQQAIEVYRMDAGGGLRNSLPNGEVGDTGRDDHWWVQIQALGWSAEVAWKQGIDLFADLDNRLLALAELYNQYSIAPGTVSFIPFGGYSAYYTNWGIAPGVRHQHPFNNIIENAYVRRKGIPSPYTSQMRGLAGEGAWSFLYLKSADNSTAQPLTPIIYPADLALPANHLSNIDIGNPGIKGSAGFAEGVWTVKGAGNSSQNSANFTFKPVTGDAGIVVKVTGSSLVTAGTGLMIRESLAPGSRYMAINLAAAGGISSSHYQPKIPWWLKLERVGNRIFTYHSHDGQHWTNLACTVQALPADTYIGFYTISNNTSALNTATFSDVAVSNTSAPGSPEISSILQATGAAGSPFSYAVSASNAPAAFRAADLPAGLVIDSLSGIISGIPLAAGSTAVRLAAGNNTGTGTAVLVIDISGSNVPSAPAGLTALVNNNTSIAVSWPAVQGASAYAVKRSLSADGPFEIIQSGITGTSYIDAAPLPELDNYYVVSAFSGTLESSNSNAVFASVPPAVPSTPVAASLADRINLSWDAAAGAVSYKVKRAAVSGGPYATVAVVSANSYSDTAVSQGIAYYYVVSSAGNTQESADSKEVFGVPGAGSLTWSPVPLTDSLGFAQNWIENRSPVNPAILTFNNSADSVLTNDIPGLEVSRILFSREAGAYTITGDSMTLKTDIVNNSPAVQTLTLPLVLADKLNVITNTNTGHVSLSGEIRGEGSLMKTGPGILYISGNNTYSGNTIINGTTGGWPAVNAIAIAGQGTGSPSSPVSGPLGRGKIIMNGGSLFSAGGDATLYNDIEIRPERRSYIYQTTNALNLRGRLLGSGIVEQDGNTYAGLHLFGDNSEFTGTFISKLRSGNSRTRFEVPQAGSAKANWLLDNTGNDTHSIQFSAGTLHFGSLSGRGYLRNNGGGSPVISIGALNTNSRFEGGFHNFLNVEKVGTGDLAFTGNHTYGGTTTVKKGRLLLNNNPASGTFNSPVIVEEGSFGGTGKSAGSVTIGTGAGPGASLEPGSPGIGSLIAAGLTMKQDATYKAEINLETAQGDKIAVSSANLTGRPRLIVNSIAGTMSLGTSYTIIDNTGEGAVIGMFKDLPEMGLLQAGNYQLRITYKGGTGNDVQLLDDRSLPVIITSSIADTAITGRPFSYAITAIKSPDSFSAGGLPAGLSFNQTTGLISGIPSEEGMFQVVLTASNESSSDTLKLALTIQNTQVKGLIVAEGDGKNIAEWEAVKGMSYNIKRSGTAGGPYNTIASTTATKYTDTEVSNGSLYYYVVTAADSAGEYAAAAEVQARPNAAQHAYWKFDEQSGGRAIDRWGANHALLAAAATREAGKYGQALKLNGTAASYASLPAGLLSTLNDFTITVWVKMNSISNWMRVFDFGSGTSVYMFLTVQSGVSGNKSVVRYAAKNGGTEQQVSYNYTFPLNTWTQLAVTQSGNTCRLYINGAQVASNNNISIKPSVLGSTTLNYLGKSQHADPLLNGSIDEFKVYSRALSDAEISQGLKLNQLVSIAALPVKRPGDAGFNVDAAVSSGLPLVFTSSDEHVATITNTGAVTILGHGQTVITATQPGNENYHSASAAQTLQVLPVKLKVLYLDGDNRQVYNNSIRPCLNIVNEDSASVAYQEITARYWFTAENYTGINNWIDYAQAGNTAVKMKYVALNSPADRALAYIEYSFDRSGSITPGGSTGPIQSRFANQDWSLLNEADDYSYQESPAAYTANDHITLYRNGVLIWGKEPEVVLPLKRLTVSYQNKNSSGSGSSINTWLAINNTGNVALSYADIKLRYWFTSDGLQNLNFWKDYVKMGNAMLNGIFVKTESGKTKADTYLELSFSPSAGMLYPLSASGNIQYRISKSDWSPFNELNDYSYRVNAAMAENADITVYHKGALIYGTEPAAAVQNQLARGAAQADLVSGEPDVFNPNLPVLYPNPVYADQVSVRINKELINSTIRIKITDPMGRAIYNRSYNPESGANLNIPLKNALMPGIYLVHINDLKPMKMMVIR